ncbi:MAG TPA: indoleamine 2,3-dioxygenase, partial [Sphingorhabdus sp.]|nr:indoleamine 2,3-dioxygenase [Sphingorhabdus sp.]
MKLEDFGLSAARGYLSSYEIDEIELPQGFDEMLDASARLSDILTTGRTRHWLKQVGYPDMAGFLASADDAQVRTAMVHYSFLVQAYVWGEADAPTTLPANLAIPIFEIGEKLGLPPLLPYSGYVLDNWYRLDK